MPYKESAINFNRVDTSKYEKGDRFLDQCIDHIELREKNTKQLVIEYLQASSNLGEISREGISKHMAVSSRTLSRNLKKYNVTYHSLLDEERMRRCQYFINNGITNGADLAELLGYSDPAYFYQSYKRLNNLNFSKIIKTGSYKN